MNKDNYIVSILIEKFNQLLYNCLQYCKIEGAKKTVQGATNRRSTSRIRRQVRHDI